MIIISRDINFRLDEKYLHEYYEKRKMLRELEKEVDEMSSTIKEHLTLNNMIYSRAGAYTTKLNTRYKPTKQFIQLMRDSGYDKYIEETCNPKNFDYVCEVLKLNKDDYREAWYKILFVNKKKNQ